MPGSKLAVRVDNAASVTALDFDVHYDPALLTLGVPTLAAGLPLGWSLTFNPISAGVLKVTASGTTPLSGSNIPVVLLDADVPATAPYGDSQVIRLVNVRVNEDLIASKADYAVHKAVFLGDADGSGIYGGTDASLISRVVVNLDTGFDAHDWTDPLIVGDASGDGTLSGLDASYIAQEASAIDVPEVPPLPGFAPPAGTPGIDPELSIPLGIEAVQGGMVTVPVNIDVLPAETVLGATIDIFFDENVLTYVDTNSGAFWDSVDGWTIVPNLVNDHWLRLTLYNSLGTTSDTGLGEVASVEFSVSNSAVIGSTSDLNIEPADPGEGGLTWSESDGSVLIAAIPGDYDHNGFVEEADYLFWRSHFGDTSGIGLQADGNGNGKVDAADYSFWRDAFEGLMGAGSEAGGAAAVSSAGDVTGEPAVDAPTPSPIVTAPAAAFVAQAAISSAAFSESAPEAWNAVTASPALLVVPQPSEETIHETMAPAASSIDAAPTRLQQSSSVRQQAFASLDVSDSLRKSFDHSYGPRHVAPQLFDQLNRAAEMDDLLLDALVSGARPSKESNRVKDALPSRQNDSQEQLASDEFFEELEVGPRLQRAGA